MFNAISVANAVAATLTRLLPRLTLAIILLGFDFNLSSDFEPGNFSLNIWRTFERLTPTKATSRPLKNPERAINNTNAIISYSNCIDYSIFLISNGYSLTQKTPHFLLTLYSMELLSLHIFR